MSNGTSSSLNSEPGFASIPIAKGGLARLALARVKSAGLPVAPILKRVGVTPELVAEPERGLSVRSQIALLDEVAIVLKDDCIGFTLARDLDPREIGLLYYVIASSQTLGDALKRIARYSRITNEALVFGYREGNRLSVSLACRHKGLRWQPAPNARHVRKGEFPAVSNRDPVTLRRRSRAARLLDHFQAIPVLAVRTPAVRLRLWGGIGAKWCNLAESMRSAGNPPSTAALTRKGYSARWQT